MPGPANGPTVSAVRRRFHDLRALERRTVERAIPYRLPSGSKMSVTSGGLMKEFMLRYQIVFQLIVLVCGVVMFLMAQGVIPASSDPEQNQRWRATKASRMKFFSIMMILCTLVGILSRFL